MFDYIIVGQGLAGSVLAYTLIERGCRVLVIDAPAHNHASQVAAGLYNPVTGRKMVKTWKADTLFPFLDTFYVKAESRVGVRFLHQKQIYRPFMNVEEQNDWMGKSSNNQFAHFVQQVAQESMFGEEVDDPFGGLLLQQSGYLDIPVFIERIRDLLMKQKQYREGFFDVQKLKVAQSGVCYDGISAKGLLFCDGPAGAKNHFFQWLPFRPVKGEMLYIVTEKKLDMIYNRGVFVLSVGKFCKVGATYDHQDLSLEITQGARAYLLKKLNILLKTRYKVISQVAGIRPATQDRRPLVGTHPELKPLHIFNGLGTKGVSLAPYFASQMADFLLQGKALDHEVDISRYYQFYPRVIA